MNPDVKNRIVKALLSAASRLKAAGAPVLYHGTSREAADSIARQGILPSEGWGGAGTEGVYLSSSKTGALMWAMSSLLSKKDEGGDPSKFFARGHSADELVLLEVRIPDNRLSDLKADMEQAEDYQYDGTEDDWEASLDQIGDVRFDGPIPAAWVKPLPQSEVEAVVGKLGYSKVTASVEGQTYSDSFGEWKVQDIVSFAAKHKKPRKFSTQELADAMFSSSDDSFDEPPGSPDFVRRAERASLSYPIVVVQYEDGLFVADGNHRLWKAKYIEDRDTIDGYLLTEADLRAIPQIGEPVSAATVVEKNGRPRGTFFGDGSGNWEYVEGYPLGLRGGWQASIGLSSENNWKNLSVNGATEFHKGFLRALGEIVEAYPEVAAYHVQFDGPWMLVSEVLVGASEDFSSITFLHGTSSELVPTIMRDGLQPRKTTGVAPAYGHGSSAPVGNSELVYLTTQNTMARAAARAAARVHGGQPVVLQVRGIDWRYARPDEDSRTDTAEESLAKMGSIGYARTIPASLIKA